VVVVVVVVVVVIVVVVLATEVVVAEVLNPPLSMHHCPALLSKANAEALLSPGTGSERW